MKRLVVLMSIAGVILFFTACSQNGAESETVSLTKESRYGDLSNELVEGEIAVEVTTDKKEYAMPGDKIIFEVNNTGSAEVGTGNAVYIEKQENGIWYRVPYKEFAFADKGILIEPETVYEDELPVEFVDYKWTKGNYRVIKTFGRGTEDFTLAVEFNVVE